MPHCATCDFKYLRTPMGAVKVVHALFGSISLILVAVSYIPVWTLSVFIGIVAACLCLSLAYLTVYMTVDANFLRSKTNRILCLTYHALAGTALVVAGIELIGWSEFDTTCKHKCSPSFLVGVAKTFTFINGTLYIIVAFLGVKDDDMLDSEAAEEDMPLLRSTTLLTSIPGGINQNSHYYPHQRVSIEDIRSQHYYPYQNYRRGSQNTEYSLNNSYSSSVLSGHVNNGDGRRARNMACSVPASSAFTDLQLIKE